MKTKLLSLSLLLLLFAVACGRPKPMEPQAPAEMGGLARQTLLTGAEAKAKIDEYHVRANTPTEAWAASYGAGDRLWVFAAKFGTPQEALDAVNNMSRAAPMKGRYLPPSNKSIAYQAGLVMTDRETKATIFFFARDNWVVATWNTVVSDVEFTVGSIEWVPARS